MTKVLITGGAGFIGGHLAGHLLENGCSVDLIDNFKRGVRDGLLAKLEAEPRVRLIERDLLAADGLAGLDDDYDHIYHLAAIIGVAMVLERPFEVLRDNTTMLVNALEFAARQKQLSRFLFASTSEVYAGTLKHFELAIPTPEDTPLAITDPASPRTSYMLSKIYGEALCLHSGLPVTLVRPHNFYGPRMGMAHVIPELLKKAHQAEEGAAIEVFSLDHRRTFCYIQDAVRLMAALVNSDEAVGRVFNIGSPAGETAIGDLAQAIFDLLGKDQKIDGRPATPGSPTRRCPDLSRTLQVAGLDCFTSLEDGLRQTWDWYREQIFEGNEVCAK